jgi:DNA polymerase III epsilon subunit-like protein
VKITRRIRRKLRALKLRSWARSRLRLQDAVILDTETTDLFGQVIQISVIDLTGQVLLSTLVRPTTPVSAAATAVHGISDQDLLASPALPVIAEQLLEVTRGRQLLAYNAPYDRQVLTKDLTTAGQNWVCLMRARALVENRGWVALGGPHHALGDCLATLDVLHGIARRPT